MPPYTRPAPRLWPVLGVPPAVRDALLRMVGLGRAAAGDAGRGRAAVLEPGQPEGGDIRRDVLRQGRLGADPPGVRGQLAKDIDKPILAGPGRTSPIPTDPAMWCIRRSASGSSASASRCSGSPRSAGASWSALLGTLSVLMLCRIGRRLFRSTFLGCLGGRADGGGRPALRDEPHRAARPGADVLRAGGVRLPAHRPGPGAAHGSPRRCRWTRTACCGPDAHGRRDPAAGLAPVAAGGRPDAGPGRSARSGTACT